MVAVGSGKFTYHVVEGWGTLPAGWQFTQVAGVAVDSQDKVYVFNRSPHPVIIFDRDGRFLGSWGEGHFKTAHGICIGPDGNVYLADSADHTVKKFSLDGRLLTTLGTKDKPAEGGKPFNKPTDVWVGPNGDIYVSDGYGNARTHRFSSDGRLIKSWGTPGNAPGQFNLPHAVVLDMYGRVLVADRENHRIQVFTLDGEYVAQWAGLRQPADLHVGREGVVFVAELQSRVSILSLESGQILASWGGEKSREHGKFIAPHAICTDSRSDLYVGEVLEGQRIQKFARK
jgi:DNA-binding beta-propeller fold protein YncE